MATSYRNLGYRLRMAVQDGDLALVQRLRYKTDIRNTDSPHRLTSLAWAAICGREEIFEWLLFDAGHDEEELSRDSESSTILHLLASLPSSLAPPPPEAPSAYDIKNDKKRKTELQAAAVRMTNMYWDAFPDIIDWSNAGGKTALHVACQSGNHELVKTLCELGADLDLTDLQGNTPLHYAAAWNSLPCIRILLEFGAHPPFPNNLGFTAIDYAYSESLAKEFQKAIEEVRMERRLARRQKQELMRSQQSQGGHEPSGTSESAISHLEEDSLHSANSQIARDHHLQNLHRSLAHRESFATSTSEEQTSGYNSPSKMPTTPPQLKFAPADERSPLRSEQNVVSVPLPPSVAAGYPMTPSRYQQQQQTNARNLLAVQAGKGNVLNPKTSSPALMQHQASSHSGTSTVPRSGNDPDSPTTLNSDHSGEARLLPVANHVGIDQTSGVSQ